MNLVTCPHCQQLIEIVELNCQIFRCGIYKHNGEQISPHLPKIECDRLMESNAMYGCGKPFRVNSMVTEVLERIMVAEICDYL